MRIESVVYIVLKHGNFVYNIVLKYGSFVYNIVLKHGNFAYNIVLKHESFVKDYFTARTTKNTKDTTDE